MLKMRERKNCRGYVECYACGERAENSIAMFEILIQRDGVHTGGSTIMLCDACMEILSDKSLTAKLRVYHKTKTPHDLAIIRKRLNGTYIKPAGE